MAYGVIIPSRNPANCLACVRAVLEHEPDLPPHRIVIVDDGARSVAAAKLPGISWVTGEKPFIFARNINLGVRYALEHFADDGVVLLNDDARLLTREGFDRLAELARAPFDEPIGLVSPVFTDAVGNRRQLSQVFRGSQLPQMLRVEPQVLCFICVYIPIRTWRTVGELDERYVAYGWDDNDYCRRVRNAGRLMLISEDCLIEHGTLPSTFRPGNRSVSIEEGRKIFEAKWQN